MCSYSPGDLLIAPLWSIGTSILQGFKYQQVALSVTQQQVGISSTCSIQKTFHSLEDRKSSSAKHYFNITCLTDSSPENYTTVAVCSISLKTI